jgi:hypothetical protein
MLRSVIKDIDLRLPPVCEANESYIFHHHPEKIMDIKHERRAVGIFPNRFEVENALAEIKSSGFPMDNVAVVGRNADTDDQVAGVEVHKSIDNKADEGAVAGAVTGGALGGVTGLLVGLGTLAIPGVGPVVLAGAAATALATTLAGTAIGAGGASLLGALIGLGIPDNEAKVYGDLLEQGYYLIIVDGTEAQVLNAGEILNRQGVREWQMYDVTNAAGKHANNLL